MRHCRPLKDMGVPPNDHRGAREGRFGTPRQVEGKRRYIDRSSSESDEVEAGERVVLRLIGRPAEPEQVTSPAEGMNDRAIGTDPRNSNLP